MYKISCSEEEVLKTLNPVTQQHFLKWKKNLFIFISYLYFFPLDTISVFYAVHTWRQNKGFTC